MPITLADRRLAIAPGLLLALLLALPPAPAGAETAVRLKNASWEFTTHPDTLQVAAALRQSLRWPDGITCPHCGGPEIGG